MRNGLEAIQNRLQKTKISFQSQQTKLIRSTSIIVKYKHFTINPPKYRLFKLETVCIAQNILIIGCFINPNESMVYGEHMGLVQCS